MSIMPSEQPPTISYVLCSRNDQYVGSWSLERMMDTLRQLAHLGQKAEILLVDWGTDLAECLSACWDNKGAWPILRVFTIPQSVTNQFHFISEVHSLNLAARFAASPWVARIDQDILVGQRFAEWFHNRFIQDEPADTPEMVGFQAYFSLRRDLPKDSFDFSKAQVWNHWDSRSTDYWRGAVGCLLVPRSVWLKTRGYSESLIYRNHMEHDFIHRLRQTCGLTNLGPLVGECFYHQWHCQQADRPSNPMLEVEQFSSIPRNTEDWGLRNYWQDIKETVL